MSAREHRPLAMPPRGSGLEPVPGHSGGIPVVGETLTLLRNPDRYLREVYEADGPVAWRRGLGRKMVMALGPDAWTEIQQNKDKAFANGPGYEPVIGRFFHRGVLLLDFDEHLFHRRIMQAAFARDRLIGYLDRMNPAIEEHLGRWQAQGELKAAPAFKELALDVATKTFLGVEAGDRSQAMGSAFNDCVVAAGAVVRVPLPGARYGLPGTEWSRGIKARQLLESELGGLVAAKRASEGTDLFSVLCNVESEDGEVFTDEDIVNHMVFLMFAAHDTSTATMTSMAYHLARNPEWQERCRAESLALGQHATYDELQQLTSLDLVMKESLRMTPPIPMLFRSAVKDTQVLGRFIPEGTIVGLLPHFSHHMPEYWTNPYDFDPERFSEERREDKGHRNAWVPFGSSAHKCIGMYFAGMEIKATLHQLLRTSRWSLPVGYRLRWATTGLPQVRDGLPIHVQSL